MVRTVVAPGSTRRGFLQMAGGLGLATSFAACGLGGTSGGGAAARTKVPARAPKQATTIEFWRRNYSPGGANSDSVTTDAAIKAFQKRYPTITVKPIGDPAGDATNQKYDIAILQQGAGPDVFSSTGPELLKYAAAGALAIPDLGSADLADYDASALAASRVEGELAGYPLWIVPWFQFVNVQHFREASVPVPTDGWTYDTFRSSLERLSGVAENRAGWAFYSGDYSFMLLDGARPLDKDQSRWTYSSKEAASALTKWAEVVADGSAAPGVVSFAYDDSVNLFVNRGVSVLQNPAALATQLSSDPSWRYGTDWDVVPSPRGAGDPTTWTALGYVGVLQQDDEDRVGAAQLFASYITGPEVGADLAGEKLQWWQAPAARASARGDFAAYHPAKAKIASFLDSVYVQPNIEKWSQIDGQYLGPARDSALTGEKSASAALREIAAPVQGLLG
ncbi:extracellular solute-binding protein [Nocardioides carbamazepini]|uniref:ABC transporter substrate-binding protein n=1 Tax=Nocardioides carbamazepini TaxID=2854259 RepID=UPI002149A7F9|nr:hypothetical protein [Nocardioides carbamazepini]MCR1782365.1 extracellular solute-binding protein [Nocardioides carbamazepini]